MNEDIRTNYTRLDEEQDATNNAGLVGAAKKNLDPTMELYKIDKDIIADGLVDDVEQLSFNNISHWKNIKKILKYILTLLAIAIAVAGFTIPFLTPFAPILAISAVSIFSFGQILTSNDKLATIAKGISVVVSLLTASLVFIALPVSTVSLVLAAGMFYINKILYDGDVSKLLKSFKHFFNRDGSKYGWLKNSISTLASAVVAYLFTMGMFVGAANLLVHFPILAGSIIVTPYIVIPIMLCCGIANLAFAKRGLDYVVKKFETCFFNNNTFQFIEGWKKLIGINADDKTKTKIIKTIKFLLISVVVSGLIAGLSQISIIRTFTHKIAAFNFNLPKYLAPLNLITNLIISSNALIWASRITRIAIITPKVSAVINIIIPAVEKLKNTISNRLFKRGAYANANDNTGTQISNPPMTFVESTIKQCMLSENKESRIKAEVKKITDSGKKQNFLDKIYTQQQKQLNDRYLKLDLAQTAFYFIVGMSHKLLYPFKFIALGLNTVGNFVLAGDIVGQTTNGAASFGVNGQALSSNLNNGLFANYKPKPDVPKDPGAPTISKAVHDTEQTACHNGILYTAANKPSVLIKGNDNTNGGNHQNQTVTMFNAPMNLGITSRKEGAGTTSTEPESPLTNDEMPPGELFRKIRIE